MRATSKPSGLKLTWNVPPCLTGRCSCCAESATCRPSSDPLWELIYNSETGSTLDSQPRLNSQHCTCFAPSNVVFPFLRGGELCSDVSPFCPPWRSKVHFHRAEVKALVRCFLLAVQVHSSGSSQINNSPEHVWTGTEIILQQSESGFTPPPPPPPLPSPALHWFQKNLGVQRGL